MVERKANQPQKVLPLAPREKQVFDFVKKRYRQTRGKALVPQLLIAEGLGIKRKAVNQLVTNIEEKGYPLPVVRRKGKTREVTQRNIEKAQARKRRKQLVDEVLKHAVDGMTNYQIYISINQKRDLSEKVTIGVVDGILHVFRTRGEIPRKSKRVGP